MVLFVIVLGYGNRHLWYQLPLVPIAAAFAGAVCAFVASKISSRVIAVTLSILLMSSFATLAFWCVQPFYQSSAAQLRDAGLELKKVTPPDALIVAADMGDPTIFYYAERKGWHFLRPTRFTTATRTTASRQSRILSGCVGAEQRILFSRKTHSGG